MSKFIGKRVFYSCSQCEKPFTLSKKCVDKSEDMNLIFCSKECCKNWEDADEKAAIENAFFGTVAAQVAERLPNSAS
jgi:hypothetical protein